MESQLWTVHSMLGLFSCLKHSFLSWSEICRPLSFRPFVLALYSGAREQIHFLLCITGSAVLECSSHIATHLAWVPLASWHRIFSSPPELRSISQTSAHCGLFKNVSQVTLCSTHILSSTGLGPVINFWLWDTVLLLIDSNIRTPLSLAHVEPASNLNTWIFFTLM